MEKVSTVESSFARFRVVMVKNEPWFVAKDVCASLGIKNNRDSVEKALDEEEKGVASIYTLGGPQEMVVVNESGLYSLIFQSRKPEARAFRKWVTSEVLPSIRRYGYYIDPSRALSTKDRNAMRRAYYKELGRYITTEDIYKCSKKFRRTESYVENVLAGNFPDEDIMAYLQERALANKENRIDAYSDKRMQEVLNLLK